MTATTDKSKGGMLLELRRKGIHLSATWISLLCYFTDRETAFAVLGTAAIGMLLIDILRISGGVSGRFVGRMLGPVLRSHEKRVLTGASYMMFSSVLCLYFYGPVITAAVVAYLVLGDTVAALAGKRWGSRGIFGKTWVGTAACCAVCLAVGLVIPELGPGAAVAGAVTAAAVELLPLRIDDNFTIPVISGAVLSYVL